MDRSDTVITGQNYHKHLDYKKYCQEYYSVVLDSHKPPLKLLHNLYSSYGSSPAGLKVLDYGCGPVVAYEISAALQASEIVMAECTEGGRKQVQLWVDKEPAAMDWNPFFKYVVVTLEGKSEQEAVARQDELRRRIKAIVSCDITADPPIQPGYNGPYDVVFSSLTLNIAFSSVEGYESGVAKLANLVKPGGKLCLFEIESNGISHYYTVGSVKYYALSITREILTTILTKLGFTGIEIQRTPRDQAIPQEASDYTAMLLALATKC